MWDIINCSPGEVIRLYEIDKEWRRAAGSGLTGVMDGLHEEAEGIRNKHRQMGERGASDGSTVTNVLSRGVIGNILLKTPSKSDVGANENTNVVEFSLKFGGGAYVQTKFLGIGVEVGGKMYYDLTTMFSDQPTQSLEFSAMVSATDNVQIGGSITGTIDPTTKQHLKNNGFAGIKIGDTVMGFDDLPKNKDFKIDLVSVGGYVGVGGEATVTINVSALFREIFK